MPEDIIQSLETLTCEKILLYENLRDCLLEERECLIQVDLDRLWALSREKESLCRDIGAVRGRLMASAGLEPGKTPFRFPKILDPIPERDRSRFHALYLRLMRSKAEIESLRKENMAFLDESLRFMDEIISIITGKQGEPAVYNRKCRLRERPAELLLRREV